jgi:hypothetical protein
VILKGNNQIFTLPCQQLECFGPGDKHLEWDAEDAFQEHVQ